MGRAIWSVLGIVAAALIGAGAGIGLYVNRSSPPATEQRWSNVQEVTPIETADFARLLGSDPKHWRDPSVTVYTAPYAPPHPHPITLSDLSDSGQAHVIDLLKGASPPASAWLQLMQTIGDTSAPPARADPYRVDRVLIATVARGLDALPGERLLWTRVFVQPINFQFAGYTVAATDSRSVKIADIESASSTKLSLNAAAEAGVPGLANPSVGQEIEKTQKSSTDISEQYENLGIDIQPDFLRIIRESAAGGDVAGNAAIQLSMITDPMRIWCDKPGGACRSAPSGRPASAADPDNRLVLLVSGAHLAEGTADPDITILPQTALPHCALKAKVWMLYEVRHIMGGRRHYVEGMQKVELRKSGYDAAEADLVAADDISPAVWSIKVAGADGRVVADSDPDLTMQTGDSTRRRLVFTDHDTASELVHWLKVALAKNPSAEPTLKQMTFHVGPQQTLTPFKHVADDCRTAPPPRAGASE